MEGPLPSSASDNGYDTRRSGPAGDPTVSVLAALPDPVLVLDEGGRVEWISPTAENVFESTLEDAVGQSAFDFIHPDDVDLALRSLVSVQEKELGLPIELRVRTPDGWHLFEVVGRPIPAVRPGAVVFCLRDITARRRFEVAHDDVAKFRTAVHNAATVTLLVTPAGVVEAAPAGLSRLCGRDPEAAEGRMLVELMAPGERRAVEQALALAAEREGVGGAETCQVVCLGSGGREIPVEMTVVSLLEDPTVGGYVVSLQDVSERDASERDLRLALSLLTAALEATADGILVLGNDGAIERYNTRFAELWQLAPDALAVGDDGRALSGVLNQLADPDRFVATVAELGADPEAETFDTLELRDGRVFERYSMPQRVGDEVVGRVWSFRDVTERQQREESLTFRAFHDPLTQLANRDVFAEHLRKAIARAQRGNIAAVLFIDVDGMKAVNDRFGHAAGDEMLVAVARALETCVRGGDTVARLGGDEFGVLAEDLPEPGEATALAERIHAAVTALPYGQGRSLQLSVSVGIAFAEHGESAAELLARADRAMYAAKSGGPRRLVAAPQSDAPGA